MKTLFRSELRSDVHLLSHSWGFSFFLAEENGLQSGRRAVPAATSERRHRRSLARGRGEDEGQSEVDGRSAGGQAEQGLPGNRAVNFPLLRILIIFFL